MVTTGRAVQGTLADLTPLVDTTFVVLDLETTGLSPERDHITEVGAVRSRGGEVLAELRSFIHPGVPIPPGITAITGITDVDVADAPPISTALPLIVDFIGSSVFVAHNAPFDLGFLRAAARRLGMHEPAPIVLDTAVLARRLVRDEVRDVRLGTLARHFRAPAPPDHRALTDARATLHVLHALIERAGTLGATTLEDLVMLCGPTGDRSHRRIDLVKGAPSAPGVYRFLADDGTVLYVGKATDLRRRLRSYFGSDTRRRTADLVAATARVEWTITSSELEAGVLELRELQANRPRYNHRSTRPDVGTTVTLTDEPFPRLAIVRGAPAAGSAALGPVPRAVAELVVAAIESVVPLRPCRPRLRRAQDHEACVLKDLHRCDAPCDGTQTPAAYARTVAHARDVLGDPSLVLPLVHEVMTVHAADGEFERAAEVREQLAALVRAYTARRHLDRLRSVRVVLARPVPLSEERALVLGHVGRDAPVELVAVARGRFVAGALTSDGSVDASLQELVAHLDRLPEDPGGAADALQREELALLGTWMDRDGVRVLHAEGELCSQLAGGAQLAETDLLLRRTRPALRGDDVLVSRDKVRRR